MTRRLPTLLLYAGIAGIVAAMMLLHAQVVAVPSYRVQSSNQFPWSILYAALLGVSAYVVGLPDVPRRARQVAAAAVSAVVIAVIAVSTLALAAGGPLLPRFVVLATSILGFGWFSLCAFVAQGDRSRARNRERVVIVGEHDDVATIERELRNSPERHASVVGHLTVAAAQPTVDDPFPVRRVAEQHHGTLVVLDRSAQGSQLIVDQVAMLHEDGVRVRTLSLFYEQWLGKLPIGELERISLMFDIGEIHRMRYSRLKRLIDLSLAVVLLPVLAAAIPVVLIGNLIANRGPLFFYQERIGKGGCVFRIHKFRTMRPSGDAAGAWAEIGDERVTAWGRILRVTHLDELPQLLNIIRGDLSLVGPRPEQPQYVAELEAKLPYYQLRHLVQPGLTGWAQVKYGYARTEGDALEKLQFEFYYLRRQALAVDLRIMVRTLRTILPFGGPSWL